MTKGVIVGISASLVLFAIGAFLDFAVDVTTSGLNLHAVGVILMVVGSIGFLLSLIFWSSWGGFGLRRTYISDASSPVVRGRVVRDEEVV